MVGENGYAESSFSRPGGEYLQVSGFDCPAQVIDKICGHGLAFPEGLFQECQGC